MHVVFQQSANESCIDITDDIFVTISPFVCFKVLLNLLWNIEFIASSSIKYEESWRINYTKGVSSQLVHNPGQSVKEKQKVIEFFYYF